MLFPDIFLVRDTGDQSCTAECFLPNSVTYIFPDNVSWNCTCETGFSGLIASTIVTPQYTGPVISGSLSGLQCDPCRPGTYKDFVGGGNCTTCPIDYDSLEGAKNISYCYKCPNNSVAPLAGEGCKCNISYTPLPGQDTQSNLACAPCAEGTYKDTVGNEACTQCPPERPVSMLGSGSVGNCFSANATPTNSPARGGGLVVITVDEQFLSESMVCPHAFSTPYSRNISCDER